MTEQSESLLLVYHKLWIKDIEQLHSTVAV